MLTNEAKFQVLKTAAERSVASYPQYRGHFDNYILVRIRRTVRTKFGVAFEKGDYAIAAPQAHPVEGQGVRPVRMFRDVWSQLNEIDTSIEERHVEVIQ